MKLLTFTLLCLLSHISCLADSNTVSPDTKWTHSWSQGEDATSSFYYFFEDMGQVKKMRMMWNGGAQNNPSITDYIFESGNIRILTQEANRKNIPDLILGKDTGLKVLTESKISALLAPEPPRKILNDEERIHLSNILGLLLEDRTLYKLEPHKAE